MEKSIKKSPINNLPKDYLAFMLMLALIHYLVLQLDPQQHTLWSEETKGEVSPIFIELIKNSKASWRKIAETVGERYLGESKDIKEMLKETVIYCVFPKVVELMRDALGKEKVLLLDQEKIDKTVELLIPKTARAIAIDKGIATLFKLSDKWQKRRFSVLHRIRDWVVGGVWPPLFYQTDIVISGEEALEGWHILTLNTGKQLNQEGARMEHCIGGYAHGALLRHYHILSIQNEHYGPESTLQLALWEGKGEILINRRRKGKLEWTGKSLTTIGHYSINDQAPKARHKKALNWLKQQVESGTIQLNLKGKFVLESFAVSREIPPILNEIGFIPTADKRQYVFEQMRSTEVRFKKATIVPKMNVDVWLETHRLLDSLERVLQKNGVTLKY
ncbi:MAG: hypothetical protein HQM14_20940 [SAR324 cluster bacterium]|nr:hypothetical protein [SAR324 cluster bacterium]